MYGPLSNIWPLQYGVLQQRIEMVMMTSSVTRISEWGWGLAKVWGRNLQLPEAIGGLGASPPETRGYGNGVPTLGDFCYALIKK